MVTVSVVMPTHNRANLIGEAISSVLDQTFQDFDLHIIDNGSTDNTKDVVDSFDDERLNYFWQEDSGLPADSRNVGIARSGGEFIAFIDSDDLWLSDKLEHQVKAMTTNANCGIVTSNYKYIADHPLHDKAVLRNNVPTGRIFEKLLHKNFICTSMTMVRRAALEKVGVFTLDPQIPCSEDFELWLRITHDFEFEYVPKVGGFYRVHDQNLSKGGASIQILFSQIRTPEKICAMYHLPQKLIDSVMSEHYASQAFHFLRAGTPKSFRHAIRQSAKHGLTMKNVGLFWGHGLLGAERLIRLFNFIRRRGLNPSKSYVR